MELRRLIFKVLPLSWFKWLRNKYRNALHRIYKPLTLDELRTICHKQLEINPGDTVFIHSSMDYLNTKANALEILEMLIELVGPEGNLVFPSWHFTDRAETHLRAGDVFDVRNSVSVLGMLSEFARRYPEAERSLHPTNSIVAIGKDAKKIVGEHHLDIYPAGEKSPYFKVMEKYGKICGIGVDTYFMSFVHCPEDVMKGKYPFANTRLKEIFTGRVIDFEGKEIEVKTLAAHPDVSKNNIRLFTNKQLPASICRNITIRGNRFFTADAKSVFVEIQKLADLGITIYNVN